MEKRYKKYKYYHNNILKKINQISYKDVTHKYLKKCTIVVFLLTFIVCLATFYYKFFLPVISLEGPKSLEISYNEKYEEPGFVSSFRGKDITSKVKVSGEVDDSKLGDYLITYEISYHGFKTKKTRKVKVVDLEKPKLKFTNSKDVLYICPNGKYKNNDFKAVDNYDGDITDKVSVKKIGDKMYYSVSDSSGNSLKVERKILYQDILKPELILNDSTNINISLGGSFLESSYQVSDNCDSKVKVLVSGDVDVHTPGTYYKKYVAKDNAGNTTEVLQKIVVSEPNKKGSIYLTFDDGPRSGTTDIILNILKEEGVKATFFVTNGGPDDLIKRAFDEGHSIGLHTATHNYSLIYSSNDSYFNDLKLVSDRVQRITGQESKIIRFPGGSSNTISRKYSAGIMSSLTQEVVKRGYRYYDWNIDSRDAEGGRFSAEEISSFVISNLSHDRVNVVLMHDIKVTTKDALRKIIKYGKENGYTFERITPYTDMITQRVNN